MTDTLDLRRRRALARLSAGSLAAVAPWMLREAHAQAAPLTPSGGSGPKPKISSGSSAALNSRLPSCTRIAKRTSPTDCSIACSAMKANIGTIPT